jgi:hypothetical protein
MDVLEERLLSLAVGSIATTPESGSVALQRAASNGTGLPSGRHKTQYYDCPNCFATIAYEDTICPHCLVDIPGWVDAHSYFERLIHNLKHPDPEPRLGSICALAYRRDPQAAVALAACALEFPANVVQNIHIVAALAGMPASPEKAAAFALLIDHPSQVVRHEVEWRIAGLSY